MLTVVNCVSQFTKANCGTRFATMKNNKRRLPNGVAFITLNEKYNGFRSAFTEFLLVFFGKFLPVFIIDRLGRIVIGIQEFLLFSDIYFLSFLFF